MAYSDGHTSTKYAELYDQHKIANHPAPGSGGQQAAVAAVEFPDKSTTAGVNSGSQPLLQDEGLGRQNEKAMQPSGCQDKWWAVAFLVHIAAIAVLAVHGGLSIRKRAACGDFAYQDHQPPGPHQHHYYGGKYNYIESHTMALTHFMQSAAFTGALLAAVWVAFIAQCGGSCIKWTVIMKFVLSFVVGCSILLLTGSIVFALAFFVFGSVGLLWYWCVRKRLAFVAAIIEVGTAVVQQYPSIICTALATLLVSFAWALGLVYAVMGLSTNIYDVAPDPWHSASSTETDPDHSSEASSGCHRGNGNGQDGDGAGAGVAFGIVSFLLLLSFYWGMQVWRNVLHVTVAGTVGTWWHTYTARAASPTAGALKRALTTSFGTIALGSLIIAIIQTLKSMAKSAKRKSSGGARGGFAVCVCCISCIERLAEYFTSYAFVMAGLYGSSIYASASRVVSLFKERGFTAIINDSLMDTALGFGMLFVALLNAGITALWGYGFEFENGDDDSDDQLQNDGQSRRQKALLFAVLCGGLGALFGLGMSSIVTSVFHSAVQTVFVCWAEAPSALAESHPEHFGNLLDAWMERYPDVMQKAGYDRYQRPGAAASVPLAAPVAFA